MLAAVLTQLAAWGAAFAVILGLVHLTCRDLAATAAARPVIEMLDEASGPRRYRTILRIGLHALDRFLGRHEAAVRRATGQAERKRIMRQSRAAWSWGLLNLALLLAIAYPVLMFFVQWLVLGSEQAARIGAMLVLPAEPDWRWRLGTLCLIAGSLGCAALAQRTGDGRG